MSSSETVGQLHDETGNLFAFSSLCMHETPLITVRLRALLPSPVQLLTNLTPLSRPPLDTAFDSTLVKLRQLRDRPIQADPMREQLRLAHVLVRCR